MNLLGSFVLLGSIPIIALLFAWLPPRRAALFALVAGYLFVPPSAIKVPLAIPLTKETCISLGLLLGMLIFDSGRVRTIRLRACDGFMLVWCLVPIASSLSNGLGLYDGLATAWTSGLIFMGPYLAGRAYLRDAADFAALARAVAIGGLVYLPLCWFEMRMSPQLNSMVYGFSNQSIIHARRLGGWRPSVFLQHGIAVGLWMGVASIAAMGLWRERRMPTFAGIPAAVSVALLAATTVGCASTGAIVLLAAAGVVIVLTRVLRSRIPILLLVLTAPVYLVARIGFDWQPAALTSAAGELNTDRAGSLNVRFESEQILMEHAMKRPWFGWGGWGRGQSTAYATDSLWGIALSKHGLVGLSALFGSLVVAQAYAVRQIRRSGRPVAAFYSVATMIVVLAMYTLDCLLNGMLCPVFTALSGGLLGWVARSHDGTLVRTTR